MTGIHFLAGWALRSSILISGGAFLLLVLRVRDVSIRLAVWTAMLCGSLLIPAMIVTLPSVPVTVMQTVAAPPAEVAFEAAPISAVPIVIPTRPVPFDWTRAAITLYS